MGEPTWASYEPRDGEIGFTALSRVIDEAHQRGLKVIVGTPTYAVPPWLARRHPGRPLPYGARQNVDPAQHGRSGAVGPGRAGAAPGGGGLAGPPAVGVR
ncbi:beta-galactosidase [Nonomuraea angiospora]|uniref:beta-galactosidase n=1 Tax=Nonomuraea angiospora TaxID=46172 RepID=UPI0037996C7B